MYSFFYNFNGLFRWLALRLDALSIVVVSTVSILAVLFSAQLNEALVGLGIIYSLKFTGMSASFIISFINSDF